ncbi:unnamed protein product [Thlaspi arvense]|uniref:HSF-type DNA-binding domain-containing protein n=1 Tax=Thlaspi arvense TaxID=13288 RepID=A0AAU9T304_THLAR|nr:unnamed protein product [Thlaspi arvense]
MDRKTGVDALSPTRNKVYDFLSKTYAMVDDPSTDSIISWGPNGNSFIVWNPAECCRDLFPRLLGITDFARFARFDFTKIETGPQLEFTREGFVRGEPERLVQIGERYVAGLKACRDVYNKRREDLLGNCKNRRERRLVYKERRERYERERGESMDKYFAEAMDKLLKRIAKERETREGGVLSQDVEDRVERLKALF